MSVGIAPISEHIGATVTGLDPNTVTNSVTVQLREALATYVVLVFRGQQFEPPDLLKAVRVFGEPERQNYSQFNHPDFPDIGILDYEGEQTPADMWHTDSTNRECPPKATVLYALAVPGRGGDTSFANMRAAYAALPGEIRRQLDGSRTVNSFDGQFQVQDADRRDFGEPVDHPLVRTHPETGDKALYFHILKASHIIGKTPEESRLFLDGLLDSAIRPEFVYRHKWQTGDLVIVDNRSAMHRVHDDYGRSEKRLLHRVILKGDRPF